MDFPPPHQILYERMNDRETKRVWEEYKSLHKHHCEFEEIDAAVTNSMDDFAKWFGQWVLFAPKANVRIRVLLVWHAHFLSLACQQMLRRSLEQRSFRCRVWFHIEEPTLQSAIVSRCIIKTIPAYVHLPVIVGKLNTKLWTNPRSYEMELETANK
jgi:hypothetical protein